MVARFTTGHNNGLWQCLCTILPPAVRADPSAQALATLPLSMGGCGLRDALRTSKPAFWASWADCLSMLCERHPAIVDVVIDQLDLGCSFPPLFVPQELQQGNWQVLKDSKFQRGKPWHTDSDLHQAA